MPGVRLSGPWETARPGILRWTRRVGLGLELGVRGGLSWAYFLGHHPVLRVATVQACTTLVTRCGRILGPDHPDAPPRCPALPGGARHANLLGWPRNR